jgi:general secretion pathway protein L
MRMALAIGTAVRPFFAWWAVELGSMLPAAIRAQLLGGGPCVEARVEASHIVVDLFDGAGLRRRQRVDTAMLPPDRAVRRVVSSMIAEADEVVLRLPERQVLRAVFDLPLSAGDALDERLAAEIGRRTPFMARDVLWDWRVRSSDMEIERLYVELVIARRHDAEEAVAIAEGAGIAPDRLDGPADRQPEDSTPFDLLRAEKRVPRRRARAWWLRPLTFSIVILAAAWGVIALERRQAELAALDSRLVELRAENAVVSEMEERYEALSATRTFLAERKRAALPVLQLLADVTQRLPDGNWVHSYSVEDGRLTLEGFSREASRLPNLLEASDFLGDVAFVAPVRRDPQLDGDIFTIGASLELPR